MTLKEKFDVISCKDCDMPFCDTKCTMLSDWELNKLEKIADDYAIEFAEWCDEIRVERRILYDTNSIKELLDIYKEEKGL
jgi:hypothetical protein